MFTGPILCKLWCALTEYMCTFQCMLSYYDDHCLASTVHHLAPLPSPDSTLTITNVTRVLEREKSVGGPGDVLDVPLTVLDIIRGDYATPEQQKNAMVSYWLQSMPNASWNVLGGRLHLYKEMTALEPVKQYIQNPAGMLP